MKAEWRSVELSGFLRDQQNGGLLIHSTDYWREWRMVSGSDPSDIRWGTGGQVFNAPLNEEGWASGEWEVDWRAAVDAERRLPRLFNSVLDILPTAFKPLRISWLRVAGDWLARDKLQGLWIISRSPGTPDEFYLTIGMKKISGYEAGYDHYQRYLELFTLTRELHLSPPGDHRLLIPSPPVMQPIAFTEPIDEIRPEQQCLLHDQLIGLVPVVMRREAELEAEEVDVDGAFSPTSPQLSPKNKPYSTSTPFDQPEEEAEEETEGESSPGLSPIQASPTQPLNKKQCSGQPQEWSTRKYRVAPLQSHLRHSMQRHPFVRALSFPTNNEDDKHHQLPSDDDDDK
jgi:hypothetical protein